MRLPVLTALLCALTACPAAAQVCAVDMAAVDARIADLEPNYAGKTPEVMLFQPQTVCAEPRKGLLKLVCDTVATGDTSLWRMLRLDEMAWVYAYENATATEVDVFNPPVDDTFVRRRDECADTACLCAVLIEHTNDSLGGTSPYPQ